MEERLRLLEQQYFRVVHAFKVELLLFANGCAVALCQGYSVQFDGAARHLQPPVTSGGKVVRNFYSGLQQRDIELGILIDLHRSSTRIAGRDQPQPAALVFLRK